MKKSPLSPAAAVEASRTALRIHATLLPGKNKTSTARPPVPGAGEGGPAVLQSTLSTAPAESSIKLEASTMTPQTAFNTLDTIDQGLATTIYYPEFPAQIRTAVTASKEGLHAAMQNLAAAEAAVRTARAAVEIELNNGRNTLRTAAACCESMDRTEEALVSVGWTLRRTAGRPRPVAAPAALSLKNTAYEGEAEAKWSRVTNVQFYEVKVWDSLTGENPDNIPWDTIAPQSTHPASLLIKNKAVGSWLTVRVRAVGAKGPSPWTETATVRIY